jgi:hypothetical protein
MDVSLNSVAKEYGLNILNEIPEAYGLYVVLLAYIIFITVYAIMIWKFYRFLARRDILKIDFSKYNRGTHPFAKKSFAGLFFILKYVLITPVIVTFWFLFFSIFLLLLSNEQTISQILIISVSMIAAIRITSYYSEDLSKDLAKMFPFTALAVFLLNSQFNLNVVLEKVSEIHMIFDNILIFLGIIIIIEVMMRVLFIISGIFTTEEEEKKEKTEAESEEE